MPNMADITIKRADGTTDVTYTKLSPSSGDGSEAVWRSAVNDYPAYQPQLRLKAKAAKNNQGRSVRGTFVYPYTATNTTTGQTQLIATSFGSFDFVIDNRMTQTSINEAARQYANLVASELIKQCLASGFSAT